MSYHTMSTPTASVSTVIAPGMSGLAKARSVPVSAARPTSVLQRTMEKTRKRQEAGKSSTMSAMTPTSSNMESAHEDEQTVEQSSGKGGNGVNTTTAVPYSLVVPKDPASIDWQAEAIKAIFFNSGELYSKDSVTIVTICRDALQSLGLNLQLTWDVSHFQMTAEEVEIYRQLFCRIVSRLYDAGYTSQHVYV